MGGGELWAARLLRDLTRRGHRGLMLVRDANVQEQVQALGVEARVAHLGGQIMLPDALRLAAGLRRRAPDAVLFTTFKKVWLGGMGTALAGVPRTVLRIGLATDLPRRSWTYRYAIRRWVDTVVVNAESIRRDVLDDLPDLSPARVRTVWNGVRRPPVLQPGTLRRDLGIGPDTPLVGSLARLVRPKRLDRLVRAVAELPDVHCVLAGAGPDAAALSALADTVGVADRVHLLGHREDVGDVLSDLDLYAVTSDAEGMSNAMLEAMSLGIPVVSTPVTGADEALDPFADGAAPGRLAPPDPAGFAGALAELLADPDTRRSMSAAARRRAAERFDADARVAEWEKILFSPTSPRS